MKPRVGLLPQLLGLIGLIIILLLGGYCDAQNRAESSVQGEMLDMLPGLQYDQAEVQRATTQFAIYLPLVQKAGAATAASPGSHVLVAYGPGQPLEALQVPYVTWAMKALMPCEPTECAAVWRFIREGAHVSFCESGQEPWKVGALGERGLFQILNIHIPRFERRRWTYDDAFDPVRNIIVAHEIYQDTGGWTPGWICRRSIP